MGGWVDDAKSALRSLRRSPGYAVFGVGTLALGMGAAIAFAAFLDKVILRPVDFPNADRLVMVWRTQDNGFMVSPDYETRQRVANSDAFDAVAAVNSKEMVLSTEAGPELVVAHTMDTGLPTLAEAPPVLGRYFDAEDLVGEGAAVVVLSEGLWKRAFGSDPAVLGASVRLEGTLRTIVGVAPDGLRPPGPTHTLSDLWLPQTEASRAAGMNVFARIRDGLTLDQARERAKALDLAAEENEASPWSTALMPVGQFVGGRLKSPLKAVGAAVALLLLISCINVANLLLARGDRRKRETAVRAALGAGRARLGREVFFESLALALLASALGLGLAEGAVGLVRNFHPDDLGILDRVRLDPLVTVMAMGAGMGTALLFGMLPVLHRVRTRPSAVLTDRGGTSSGDAVALRRILLVGEVALSFALLAATIQITATLSDLRGKDAGLATDELLAVSVRLPEWRFPDGTSRELALQELLGAVRRVPGVTEVTVATGAPPNTGIYFAQAEAEGQPAPPGSDKARVFFGNSVEPGYFNSIGQTMVEGRAFSSGDKELDPQPYILGESAARRYFPDGGAVGGQFKLGDGAWHPVIGVVHDMWATGSATDPEYPQLYMLRDEGEGSSLIVRSADPVSLAGEIRHAIREVDSEIPIYSIQPVAARYREALARERLVGWLLSAFALTAALLAAVGLYGVASQLASRRVREFGIRISLGAHRGSIFSLALRAGMWSVALGLLVGAALAWAGLRLLETGIAGLAAADPVAFAAAGAILAAATLAAVGLPASRASRTDPVEALRSD